MASAAVTRLALMVVLAGLPVLCAQALCAQTESPQGTPPPCAVAADSVASYVDEPLPELKKQVPALRGLSFETSQDQLGAILGKTADALADLYRRIPDLMAREEVRRPFRSAVSAAIPLSRRGGNLDATLDDSPTGRYKSAIYIYRIVRNESGSAETLNEFRTDEHDHPIDDSGRNPDAPRNVGFATSWLFFFPGNQSESRFRFLGQQKVDKRETFVIAFAQNPGRERLNTIVDAPTGPCSVPSQGIAWIDQNNSQILRMQTDLLFPVPSIHLTQLRTVLEYSEVLIPERELRLWLPSVVDNSWQTPGVSGEELHLYSHYRLFGSTVRVLPDPPGAPTAQSPPQR